MFIDFVYFHTSATSAFATESHDGEEVFGLRAMASKWVDDACRRGGHVRRGWRKSRRGGKRGMKRRGEEKDVWLGAS